MAIYPGRPLVNGPRLLFRRALIRAKRQVLPALNPSALFTATFLLPCAGESLRVLTAAASLWHTLHLRLLGHNISSEHMTDSVIQFLEVELVTHSAPSASGSFVQTVVLTEIATG